MYNKILIPLENSLTDQVILQHIRKLLSFNKASIVLIHVADGFVARNQKPLNLADSEEMKSDAAYLEKIRTELQNEGIPCEAILAAGDPAQEIVKVADSQSCDLIAMATHGHKFIKDFVLGSVANAVRHETAVPVLMVRAPQST